MLRIRDVATSMETFRALLDDLSLLLAVEATRNLTTIEINVMTPLATCTGRQLSVQPVLAPVLRAGLGFMPGFLRILPRATIAHLGFFRDPQTLQAVPYYANLPDALAQRPVFILDPMLATGNSAQAAIALLQDHGATNITLVVLLAAQPGIDAIVKAHPDVHIVVAAIDPELNDHGYIVPGLGDAGDRQFGSDRSVPLAARRL